MKHRYASAVALALILGTSFTARAQTEVTILGPGGVRAPVEKLIPAFEAKSGYKVKATFGSGGGSRAQVIKGDAFDVVVIQAPYEDVVASGNVVASSAKAFASVAVGVAVKKGSPRPDISTPESVKKMLLGASSISYPNAAGGAAAGVAFDATLKQLGIADQMKPKIKSGQGGAGAMAMVAKGDVEIGLTFLSEMDDPGIDIIGPLPKSICPPTVLVGFISTHAKDPAAAKELLDFLSSPEAAAVYKSLRMTPGK
jgi:molybdate transport system substrate-binding protein